MNLVTPEGLLAAAASSTFFHYLGLALASSPSRTLRHEGEAMIKCSYAALLCSLAAGAVELSWTGWEAGVLDRVAESANRAYNCWVTIGATVAAVVGVLITLLTKGLTLTPLGQGVLLAVSSVIASPLSLILVVTGGVLALALLLKAMLALASAAPHMVTAGLILVASGKLRRLGTTLIMLAVVLCVTVPVATGVLASPSEGALKSLNEAGERLQGRLNAVAEQARNASYVNATIEAREASGLPMPYAYVRFGAEAGRLLNATGKRETLLPEGFGPPSLWFMGYWLPASYRVEGGVVKVEASNTLFLNRNGSALLVWSEPYERRSGIVSLTVTLPVNSTRDIYVVKAVPVLVDVKSGNPQAYWSFEPASPYELAGYDPCPFKGWNVSDPAAKRLLTPSEFKPELYALRLSYFAYGNASASVSYNVTFQAPETDPGFTPSEYVSFQEDPMVKRVEEAFNTFTGYAPLDLVGMARGLLGCLTTLTVAAAGGGFIAAYAGGFTTPFSTVITPLSIPLLKRRTGEPRVVKRGVEWEAEKLKREAEETLERVKELKARHVNLKLLAEAETYAREAYHSAVGAKAHLESWKADLGGSKKPRFKVRTTLDRRFTVAPKLGLGGAIHVLASPKRHLEEAARSLRNAKRQLSEAKRILKAIEVGR